MAALAAVAALIAGAGVGVIYLRIALHGERLARTVTDAINAQIRGRVEVESVTWPLSAIPRALTGHWVPVEARHVRVYDELGDLIIETELARGELLPYPAAFPRHDFILRHVEVPHGAYALIREIPNQLPEEEGDEKSLSLLTAFEPPPAHGLFGGRSGTEKSIVDIRDFEVHDVSLELAFPKELQDDDGRPLDPIEAASEEGVYALAEGVSGTGFFYADGSDPMRGANYYALTADASRGLVRVHGVEIHIEDLEIERLAQMPRSFRESVPRNIDIRARGRTPEGASFHVSGSLIDPIHDRFAGFLDFEGEVEDAGGLVMALTGGALAGDDLRSSIHVGGRALAPLLRAHARGATFDVDVGDEHPPVPAIVPDAEIELELATGRGRAERLDIRAADGAIRGEGSFLIDDPFRFDAGLRITEPLELRRYVPSELRLPLGNTQLSGTLRLDGRVNFEGEIEDVLAHDLDLELGRARIGGKVRYTQEGRLHTEGLRVRIGGTQLISSGGAVDFVGDLLDDIRLSIRSRDFHDWLRLYEAPPVARTLHGHGRYSGPRDNPRFAARLRAGAVPGFGEIDFSFVHQGERVGLRDMSAQALGGTISGGGEFALGLWPRILGFEAEANDVDLSRVPGYGSQLAGRGSAVLRAKGPFDAPDLELEASASDLAIAGEDFPEFHLSASSRGDGSRSLSGRLARRRGGALDVSAAVDEHGQLEGALTLDDLDLASLLSLEDGEPIAGGRVAARVDLAGTTDAPEVRGRLSVRQAWFHGMHLGAADVRVEPERPGVARVRGRIFEGFAEIAGTVETVAPYRADLSLTFHRAEIDRLMPELAAQAGARAWVSGEATVRGPLLARDGERPEVQVVLEETVVHVDQSDVRGRPKPVRLRNQSPILVAFEGAAARIQGEAVLSGPAGSFRVGGGGHMDELDIRLRGGLALELLAPYFRQQFEDVTGSARLDLRVTGAARSPRLSGTVDVEDIEVRLAGQDAILRAPTGKIEFANDQLAVTGFTIEVVDPYSDEVAELTVAGGVRLEDFQPRLWALHVHGSLGGKLLLALFPEELSGARGAAELSLSLLGHGPAPNIDGEIQFATERPIAIAPRGMRREILIDRGVVRFTDDLVEIERVGGWVDDEGYVADVSGEIGLIGGQPADIDVTISAEDLPFRLPQTLELLLGLREVRVVGDFDRGLEIAGDVLIVDGRYIQDFNPLLDEIRPRRVVEETPAFYETIPILANADLSLSVETRSFFVRNNVANVELTGGLEVTGTPAQPQLDGVVRVEGGAFKFQGVRAEFQRTTGTVTFERFRQFPETTPTLDIRSESEYRDFSGEDHLVVLTLTGPLGQLQWDLFTTAGLNKAQTFLLIVSGRTPEEARRVIGDEPVGRGPGEFAGTRSTESPDGNLALVDQLVKDLAGDFFSLLIEDSIRNVTDLDVARLQLGTASVGFHGEKRFTRSFRVLGDLERSLRGWAWDVRGEYRLLDQLSVEGEYLQKDFDDDVEEDVKNFRVKAVWRWLIP